jgi:hypothetical protein
VTPTTSPAQLAPVVYRIVRHTPPVWTDFLSDRAQGLPPDPELPVEHWDGMSVWLRRSRARDLAKYYVRHGLADRAYVAAVSVSAGQFRAEPSGPSHHATLWGDPAELAAAARVLEGWGLQVQGGEHTVIRLGEE